MQCVSVGPALHESTEKSYNLAMSEHSPSRKRNLVLLVLLLTCTH